MYKVAYKQGSFKNYKGAQVNFLLAAVSIPSNSVLVPVDDLGYELEGEEQPDVPKILSIGIAVQCPSDKWDENLGKQIAYGKALKHRDHILAATDPGMINTVMVNAILEQEANYLQVNPGRYIAGYDEARDKYLEAKAKKDYLNSLTVEEKTAINVVASMKDHNKFLVAVEDRRKELSATKSNIANVSGTMLDIKKSKIR